MKAISATVIFAFMLRTVGETGKNGVDGNDDSGLKHGSGAAVRWTKTELGDLFASAAPVDDD